MPLCWKPWRAPKKDKLMPTLAAASSSNGLRGGARDGREDTEPSSFSGEVNGPSSIYGYSKSERRNIRVDEEKLFKEAAKHVLALTEKHLKALVQRSDFAELKRT